MEEKDTLFACLKKIIDNRPALRSLVKGLYRNVATQVLLAIIIGGIFIYFENNTLHTIGVTIVSVAIFKFFLSTDALTTLISKTNRETFLSLDFLKSYSDSKLNNIINQAVDVKISTNFKDLNIQPIKNEIFKVIDFDGYYSNMSISYNDTVNGNFIESKQIKEYTFIARKSKKLKRTLTFEEVDGINNDDYVKIEEFIVNGNNLTSEISYEYKVITKGDINNIKVIINYPSLEEGNSTIEEKSTRLTKNYMHAFAFDYPCSNLKIIFEHDTSIQNPVIYSKFGKEEVENHQHNKLAHNYNEKVLLPDEMFFITFEKEIQWKLTMR